MIAGRREVDTLSHDTLCMSVLLCTVGTHLKVLVLRPHEYFLSAYRSDLITGRADAPMCPGVDRPGKARSDFMRTSSRRLWLRIENVWSGSAPGSSQ